jgi:hypothetical protein
MKFIKCFEDFSNSLKYHIENGYENILENVYRTGSDKYLELLKETRNRYESGDLLLENADLDLFKNSDIGSTDIYEGQEVMLDLPMEYITEAKYKDKEVRLNYPMRGGRKKFYVYVKDPKSGKVKKVEFGDTSGLNVKISDPEARKRFAARHRCDTKKDKTTPGYWACNIGRFPHLFNGVSYPGYW